MPYQMKKIEQQIPGAEPVRVLPAQPEQEHQADHRGERLVEEQRLEMLAEGRVGIRACRAEVRCHPMLALDRDPPGQVGLRSVELLVEEVAQSADRLHREQGRRNDVRPAPEGLAFPAQVQPGRDGANQQPTVDAQAAEPGERIRAIGRPPDRQQDRQRVVLVERPLVDDVVQPAADQRGDRQR